MYTKYLALVKGKDVLEQTDMRTLMRHFAELMGKPTDSSWVDYAHSDILLEQVSAYHTALLLKTELKGSTSDIGSIDIGVLDEYQQELFKYILLDIAYRTYQGTNTTILKCLVDWMYDTSIYNEYATYEGLFSYLINAREIEHFSQLNLVRTIRDVIDGEVLVNNPSRVNIMETRKERSEKMTNYLNQIDAIEIDFEGHNCYTALTVLKYQINRLLFNQKE